MSSLYSLTPWDKILHTVGVTAEAGHVHGEHTPGPSLQDVGTIGDQCLGDGGVAMAGGSVEGSIPTLILNLHSGT